MSDPKAQSLSENFTLKNVYVIPFLHTEPLPSIMISIVTKFQVIDEVTKHRSIPNDTILSDVPLTIREDSMPVVCGSMTDPTSSASKSQRPRR